MLEQVGGESRLAKNLIGAHGKVREGTNTRQRAREPNRTVTIIYKVVTNISIEVLAAAQQWLGPGNFRSFSFQGCSTTAVL